MDSLSFKKENNHLSEGREAVKHERERGMARNGSFPIRHLDSFGILEIILRTING